MTTNNRARPLPGGGLRGIHPLGPIPLPVTVRRLIMVGWDGACWVVAFLLFAAMRGEG